MSLILLFEKSAISVLQDSAIGSDAIASAAIGGGGNRLAGVQGTGGVGSLAAPSIAAKATGVAATGVAGGTPSSPFTVVTLGAQAVNGGSAGTITIPAGGVPTGAVIVIVIANNTIDPPTAVDTHSNSYNSTYDQNIGGVPVGHVSILYAYGVTALTSGNTITVTASSFNWCLSAFYITGALTTSDPQDASAFAVSTGGGVVTATPSVTMAAASPNALVVGLYAAGAGGSMAGDTWTQDTADGFAAPPTRILASTNQFVIAGGTVFSSAKLTYAPTNSVARNCTVIVMAFKPATTPVVGLVEVDASIKRRCRQLRSVGSVSGPRIRLGIRVTAGTRGSWHANRVKLRSDRGAAIRRHYHWHRIRQFSCQRQHHAAIKHSGRLHHLCRRRRRRKQFGQRLRQLRPDELGRRQRPIVSEYHHDSRLGMECPSDERGQHHHDLGAHRHPDDGGQRVLRHWYIHAGQSAR